MRVQMNLILSIPTHVCPASAYYLLLLFTTNIYYLQVVFSRGDDESDGVIRMSPGNRNVSYQPQQLILIRIRVMGQGFGQYSLLMCDYSGHQGPQP